MRNVSTGGANINFLTEEESDERIRATYGKNYDRLVAVKTKWDPGNVFEQTRTNQENTAKPRLMERTGWSLTGYVVGMHSENLRCERPPRLRRFGSFATFSYWRSHPSSVRRGLLA